MDCNGKEVCKFSPQQYRDYVAQHVEPWNYMKFTFLKIRGAGSPAPSISGVGCSCGLPDFTAFTTLKRIDFRGRVPY